MVHSVRFLNKIDEQLTLQNTHRKKEGEAETYDHNIFLASQTIVNFSLYYFDKEILKAYTEKNIHSKKM